MAAREVLISDAVVAELNDSARSWNTPTPTIAAVRGWNPVYSASDLAALKVTVVPLVLENPKLGRGVEELNYQLSIDLQKFVSQTDATAVDALTLLAEAVHDFYRSAHKLATLTTYTVTKAERPVIYDLDKLTEEGIWETEILLTVHGVG